MQKQSTTEKNPTTAGLKSLSEVLAEMNLKGVVKFNAEKIRKQYNLPLSNLEALIIENAWKEQKMCDCCRGYPCYKDKAVAGFCPQVEHVEGFGVVVRRERCKVYEERSRQEALEKQFKYAKIPLRYRGKTFADYTVDSLNRTAVDFAKTLTLESYGGAFFYGAVGTGKTFLAALIAQEFLKAGKTVLFEKVADLLTEFYAVYRGQGGSEDSILNALYNVDLLVLDDFGIEKATQFVGATLCKILDSRYNREGLTTIITSNYGLKQIAQRLDSPSDMQAGDMCLNGTRIYDRCKEICKPILFKGESRRR